MAWTAGWLVKKFLESFSNRVVLLWVCPDLSIPAYLQFIEYIECTLLVLAATLLQWIQSSGCCWRPCIYLVAYGAICAQPLM